MYEKQGFFTMELSDQKRLRSFMILLTAVQLIITIVASPSQSTISLIIGVIANLLVIYFSIFIGQAPKLYFQLFVWMVILAVIFNGWEIYNGVLNQQLFTLRNILNIGAVGLAIIFAPLIIKHLRYARAARPIV